MQIGLIFPQTEFGHDPIAVRDYAQTAEALGFAHIVAYDHILGANPDRPGGWRGPYTYQHSFLEPFVLFTFMAAHTSRIGFGTGVLILPQRETALVAKQAATLDVLCGGRLRLGVGIGWNETEYVAMNQDFHRRGRRIEEQIEVLRLLWTQPLVNYRGRWHDLPDAGLNPLPLQRPIPIWMGGHADVVLQRVARLADGWLPTYRSPADAVPHFEQLDRYLAAAGRSREDIGIDARMQYRGPDPDGWRAGRERWQELGATHLSLNTMGAGLQTPAAHLAAIEEAAAALL